MKRVKQVKDEATKPTGRSRYATKKAKGNMMYGPGCCANTLEITQTMREKINQRKRERERLEREQAQAKAFREKFG